MKQIIQKKIIRTVTALDATADHGTIRNRMWSGGRYK